MAPLGVKLRLGGAVALGGALAAFSCSPHKVTENPEAPVSVPTTFGANQAGAARPEKWWLDFGDPELSRLVATGLHGNLDLRVAWSRLAQARAVADGAGAGYWPEVSAEIRASRQKLRSPFADVDDAPPGIPSSFQINQYSASLSASYEVDLWRRVGNTSAAAGLEMMAARDEVEAAAMSLAAEIAEAYFDLVSQNAQRALIERQRETNELFLELMRLRFEKGLATSLDILQQEQQLAATRAQLPLVELAVEVGRRRLAFLLGKPPGAVDIRAPRDLPELPPVPGIGIPADLLERRPDVRAARLRVVAADHRVAVAVADRLPGLRLTGSLSEQGDEFSELIANPLWTIVGSILGPIFDGGRRAAEVDRNEAVVSERLYTYGRTLLNAIIEVETALAQEKRQREYIGELSTQFELSNRTLEEARSRYRQGLSDFLPVLTALQSQQRAELTLLQARRQLISFRIQLCRALGGTWTQHMNAPAEEEQD